MLGHSILLANMDCQVIKQINELNDNCQEAHLYFVLVISANRQASVLTIREFCQLGLPLCGAN